MGVEFLYDETPEGDTPPPMSDDDVRAALNAIPPDILAALTRACSIGDFTAIAAGIETIRASEAAFADRLAALNENFDYARILTMLQDSGMPSASA